MVMQTKLKGPHNIMKAVDLGIQEIQHSDLLLNLMAEYLEPNCSDEFMK